MIIIYAYSLYRLYITEYNIKLENCLQLVISFIIKILALKDIE